MEKLIRYLGALDWLLATGTVAVGLWLQNWLLVAFGIAGMLMAYLQPAKRVNAYITKRMTRKRDPSAASTAQVQQDEAFYQEVLGEVLTADAGGSTPARTYASAPVPYGPTYLSASKHNQLKRPHLQLLNAQPRNVYN
jgi:hypothetical protein